jgi:ribosomal protein S21
LNRAKFLNKFYLYTGIVKNHLNKKETETTQGMEYIELLTCDKRWQVCMLDFTYKNQVPEFFVFRTDPSTRVVINNYFCCEASEDYDKSPPGSRGYKQGTDTLNEENEDENSSPTSKRKNMKDLSEQDLLIERNVHYCSHSLIEIFKRLLRKNDTSMYFSQHLNFSIINEVKAHEQIENFVGQLEKIVEDNNDIQRMLKIFKRSNSDKVKFKDFKSRIRAPSSEEEEVKKHENKDVISRMRSASGKLDFVRKFPKKLSLLDYKGDNGRLEISTMACLFTKMPREQLTKTLRLF